MIFENSLDPDQADRMFDNLIYSLLNEMLEKVIFEKKSGDEKKYTQNAKS